MSSVPASGKGLFDLGGQVALVTGAAQGLGSAIAAALGAHGAAVVLADCDAAGCAAAADALRADGVDALPIPCDVADPAAVVRLVDVAAGWRGRIDTLVCNAGVQGPAEPLAETTDADRDHVSGVNLQGAARLANLIVPSMAGRAGGFITGQTLVVDGSTLITD